MRLLRSLSLLSVLVPGLLAVPVLTPAAAASPKPVAPLVQELEVAGVEPVAGPSSPPVGALRVGGARTVLLTEELGTDPFAMVGLTWDASDEVGEVEAWVRLREDGRWTGWESLGGAADEEPDADSVDTTTHRLRGGTSPLWVDRADGVQARLDVLSGAAPTGMRLSLVDPGESAADDAAALPAQSTASTSSKPPVIRSRAEWGADESIRRGSPSYASALRAATIHHTASSNDYTAADVPRLIRGFYAYHVKSQGWSDMGYNVLVDRFGGIWEGRAGGTTRPVIGSHAGGFNTGTVGISMIGTYETVTPSAAMLESVAHVAGWRLALAGVDPRGSVTLTSAGSTRYASGTRVTLPTIFGHRDVSATACPGVRGQAALPGVRTRAAALGAGAAPAVVLPGDLSVSAAATSAPGAGVPLVVTGGKPGAAVEVWFLKRGDSGFTKRRDGVLDDVGTYRTSFTADADYTYFAIADGLASPRASTRVSPEGSSAPVGAETVLRVQGPLTTPAGETALVTATGPAGAAVTVWFRRDSDRAFVQRRSGVLDATGTFTTSYVNDVPHEYFVKSSTVTSNDGQTLVGAVPNGLDVSAPTSVAPGQEVDLVVQGKPGAAVEVWFSRRGEDVFTRRREGRLAADGTYATTFVANDEYRYFAVSGASTSKRVRTTPSSLPPVAPAAAPRLVVQAPPAVDAGAPVEITVTGAAGVPVDLWFRRRGSEVWSRLREGRFDESGRWSTSYAGVDDHEYWASSLGHSSADAETLTTPVVSGPASVAFGATVQLAGRARPGDSVVVERRRRGTTAFTRSTLTADGAGAFRTTYAADDEYEYRPLTATRTGALKRTTLAPTAAAGTAVRSGTTVDLKGTARPGSEVQVWFRRDGQPSIAVGGRRSSRQLPSFVLGRTVTAGTDGRWVVSFKPTAQHSWYATADGSATPVRTTRVQ